MKLKTLLILLVVTTLLAGLSTLLLRPKTTERQPIGALLLPELPVNEIARVTLTSAEETVVLVKGDTIWQVENRYAFAADFGKLSEFLRKFSKLKIGRSFEANQETLERLQLIDPADGADAAKTGISVALADAAGKEIAAYILGSARSTDGGSGGQYLRQTEGKTIYLVDEGFRFLKKKPAEWLQQDLLDIKEDAVARVVCHPAGSDTPRFEVHRSEKGKPASLLEVPKDRTVDATKVDQLLGALAPLKIKDLAGERQDPAPTMGDGLHLSYHLYNGQQIHIFPRKVGDGEAARYELQAFVTYEAPAPAKAAAEAPAEAPAEAAAEAAAEPAAEDDGEGKEESEPEAPGSAEAADATKEEAPKAPTPEEMQALTTDLSAKVSGWTFVIEQWQWQSLITDVEGLLEEVKEEKSDT